MPPARRSVAILQLSSAHIFWQSILPGGYERSYATEIRQFRVRYAPLPLETPEKLANIIRAIALEGVGLVQLWPEPNNMASIDALAPVLQLLQSPA